MRLGVEVLVLLQLGQDVGIVVGADDGFFKNGGVGGDAAQAVLLHQAAEASGGEKIAADIIEPDGLAELRQLDETVFDTGRRDHMASISV